MRQRPGSPLWAMTCRLYVSKTCSWPITGLQGTVYRRASGVEANDIAAIVDRDLGFRCWQNTRSSKPLSPRHAVGESILLPLIYIRLSLSSLQGLEDWGRGLGLVFCWHETLAGRGLSFDLLDRLINILRLTSWSAQQDLIGRETSPNRLEQSSVSTAGTLPEHCTAECAPQILWILGSSLALVPPQPLLAHYNCAPLVPMTACVLSLVLIIMTVSLSCWAITPHTGIVGLIEVGMLDRIIDAQHSGPVIGSIPMPVSA